MGAAVSSAMLTGHGHWKPSLKKFYHTSGQRAGTQEALQKILLMKRNGDHQETGMGEWGAGALTFTLFHEAILNLYHGWTLVMGFEVAIK